MKSFTAIDIANAFIQKAHNGQIKDLTPMKLQKLMFFAQSWYLKKFGTTLINEQFERWEYGPVIPSIYYEFKRYRAKPISATALRDNITITPTEITIFLDKIIEVYGQYNGSQLSWMTHQPETAWAMGKKGSVINDKELLQGKV